MTTSKSEQYKACHRSIISADRQDEIVIVASCYTCGWEKEIPYYYDGKGGETKASSAWDEAEEWFNAHVAAVEDARLEIPEVELLASSQVIEISDLFEEREI